MDREGGIPFGSTESPTKAGVSVNERVTGRVDCRFSSSVARTWRRAASEAAPGPIVAGGSREKKRWLPDM
jgi:hypothetical protein